MGTGQSDKGAVEWAIVDETIDRRLCEITAWLRENKLFNADPEEMGSVERAYWHYGYLSALQDMRTLLSKKKHTAN